MPYLSITTNVTLPSEGESALVTELSKIVAGELKKPQAYIMVSFQSAKVLQFAGSETPAAFLDLKSIGLPPDLNGLAWALTDGLSRHAGIASSRVFITFADMPPSRWAHDGGTFA
jgi:phenylpyruvate tautomerase